MYFLLIHKNTHHECVPLTARDSSAVNAQSVLSKTVKQAMTIIIKRTFLKMSITLLHKLGGITFPQYCKQLFAELAVKRKEEADRKHTQSGANKVV